MGHRLREGVCTAAERDGSEGLEGLVPRPERRGNVPHTRSSGRRESLATRGHRRFNRRVSVCRLPVVDIGELVP